ncbi:unnamed protein product [Linum trigynum]|uniref:Uncharacterized protein n=1 Tax=Linum trigynum TaxID=586398 RepID=A0AAV2D0D8_9ROSI
MTAALHPFKEKKGSVFPKPRRLVKTMMLQAILSLFLPSSYSSSSSFPFSTGSRDGGIHAGGCCGGCRRERSDKVRDVNL